MIFIFLCSPSCLRFVGRPWAHIEKVSVRMFHQLYVAALNYNISSIFQWVFQVVFNSTAHCRSYTLLGTISRIALLFRNNLIMFRIFRRGIWKWTTFMFMIPREIAIITNFVLEKVLSKLSTTMPLAWSYNLDANWCNDTLKQWTEYYYMNVQKLRHSHCNFVDATSFIASCLIPQ